MLRYLQKVVTLSVLAACATKNVEVSQGTIQQRQRLPSSLSPQFGREQHRFGREDCVTLPALPGFENSKGVVKEEDKLCKLDFDDPALAFCPKLFSTNPGIELHEIPEGVNRESFVKTECRKTQNRTGEKEAKFKQSTSCSHTSSILTYGKLADALGVHLEVPAAVYRTMEVSKHKQAQEISQKYASGLIGQTWSGLISQINNKNPKVMTSEGLVYGALLENMKGEVRHPTLNRRGATNRASPYMASSTWQLAVSSRPVRELISPKLENLASFILIRDTSQMVLLDHIMAQQDRFGNVAARNTIYW